MTNFELNRRQALAVGSLGSLSLGMPGMVLGSDQLDPKGNAVSSEKSKKQNDNPGKSRTSAILHFPDGFRAILLVNIIKESSVELFCFN